MKKIARKLVRDRRGNYHLSFNASYGQDFIKSTLEAALCIGLYLFLFWAILMITPDSI